MSTLSDFRPKATGGGGGISTTYYPVNLPGQTVLLDPNSFRDYYIDLSVDSVTIDVNTSSDSTSQGSFVVDFNSNFSDIKLSSKFKKTALTDVPIHLLPENLIEIPGNTVDLSTVSSSVQKNEWSPDGTKFYMSATDNINQYSVPPGSEFDLTALSSTPDYVYLTDDVLGGWCFTPDGTKLAYVDSSSSTWRMYEVSLTSAYDLSTAGTPVSGFTFSGGFGANPYFMTFANEGNNLLLIADLEEDSYRIITLATPYDVTSFVDIKNTLWGPNFGDIRTITVVGDCLFTAPSASSPRFITAILDSEGNPTNNINHPFPFHGSTNHRQYTLSGDDMIMVRGLGGSLYNTQMYKTKKRIRYWYTAVGDTVYIDYMEVI